MKKLILLLILPVSSFAFESYDTGSYYEDYSYVNEVAGNESKEDLDEEFYEEVVIINRGEVIDSPENVKSKETNK